MTLKKSRTVYSGSGAAINGALRCLKTKISRLPQLMFECIRSPSAPQLHLIVTQSAIFFVGRIIGSDVEFRES